MSAYMLSCILNEKLETIDYVVHFLEHLLEDRLLVIVFFRAGLLAEVVLGLATIFILILRLFPLSKTVIVPQLGALIMMVMILPLPYATNGHIKRLLDTPYYHVIFPQDLFVEVADSVHNAPFVAKVELLLDVAEHVRCELVSVVVFF